MWKNQNKSILNGGRKASNVVRKLPQMEDVKSLPHILKHLLACLCTISHHMACFRTPTPSQRSCVAKNNLLGCTVGFKVHIATLHWYQSLSRVCLVVMKLPLDSTVCGYANLFHPSCIFFPTLQSVYILVRFKVNRSHWAYKKSVWRWGEGQDRNVSYSVSSQMRLGRLVRLIRLCRD